MNRLTSLQNFDVSTLSVADYVILSCAHQIGLLAYLNDHQYTLTEILNKFKVYRKILPSLLNSLTAYRYLTVVGDKITLNPKYGGLLSSSNSLVLKNYDWYFLIAQAPSLIKSRKPGVVSSDTYNSFIDISEKLAESAFPVIQKDFPTLFSGNNKILDLGCGKLGLARNLIKVNPLIKVTAVEQNAYPLKFLKDFIKNNKEGKAITLIEGNAIEKVKEIKGKYDFILLSHLLHWITEKEALSLLKSCKKLLEKDGSCVIYEDYLSPSSLNPKSSVRKNLSLTILGYQVFNTTEIKRILKKAGFKYIKQRIVSSRRILLYSK